MALVLPPSSQSTCLHSPEFSHARDAQRSLSSVMDSANGSRISLPPISSLIDGSSNDPKENSAELSPRSAHARKLSLPSPTQSQTQEKQSLLGSPRNVRPATPPLPPASSFDFPHHAAVNVSPPAISTFTPNYFAQGPPGTTSEAYPSRTSSYPPLTDNNHQALRTSAYPPVPEPQVWPPSHAAQAPRADSPAQDPGRPAQSSYPDPISNGSYPPTHHQQRPLPTNFPPPPPYHGQQMPPIDPQMGTQWPQYHTHPFPQQATHAYPQSQGGYPCPSCIRTFSRPSSLRIHMNSHTGEKPFACQYPGCNKRFSVRSNRKRHERGCHEKPNKETVSNGNNGSEGHSPSTKYEP